MKYYLIKSLQHRLVPILKFDFQHGDQEIKVGKFGYCLEKYFGILQKKVHEKIIIQNLSKLLVALVRPFPNFMSYFRSKFNEIFESNNFFDCNVKTLRLWNFLVKKLLEQDKTILLTHLSNLDFSSFFTTKHKESQYRIRSFQRICFLIYSGGVEQVLNKKHLMLILEKIKGVLKESKLDPRIIIMILFCLRILILRQDKKTLDDLFRNIWPSVLFMLELMLVSKKLRAKNKKNNILLATLKLLEIISCMDIDEFNLHRWTFLFQ